MTGHENEAQPSSPAPVWILTDRWALALLCVAVGLVYGDLLLSTDGTIVSHRMGDGPRYFIHLRGFMAREWLEGVVPLWNPHVFGGAPFAGVFQAAVFYPPNLIYLVLPLSTAFNLEIFLHALIMSGTTYLWIRQSGRSPAAALAAACIVTFGSTFSLRVLAGQLTVIDTHAWVPLLLWAIDRHSEKPGVRPMLWAGFATVMMLLAGHPPTAYMVAMGVGLYALVGLKRTSAAAAYVLGLIGMLVTSVLLAGIQLAAGLEIARQGTRSSGVGIDYATSFSLPPESLLTLFSPNLFGGANSMVIDYAGRWWYWDDVAYVGIVGGTLAAIGLTAGCRKARLVALGFAALFTLLAMGGYTPLFPLLHDFVPGFDLLRAPSKFMLGATLALAWLAAAGVDVLRDLASREAGPGLDRRIVIAGTWIALAALFFVLSSMAASSPGGEAGGGVTPWLARLGPGMTEGADHQRAWEGWVAYSLQMSAFVAVALAVLLVASRDRAGAVVLLVVLCVFELGFFARANRGGVPWIIDAEHRVHSMSVYQRPGRNRVLEIGEATNFAMTARGLSVWGYDPVVLDRTSRFMGWAQGLSQAELDNVGGEHPLQRRPALGLLRTRYAIDVMNSADEVVEFDDVLPQFLLFSDFEVRPWPDEVLGALDGEGFDFAHTLVLEAPPDPLPAVGAPRGTIRLVGERSDRIDLDVELEAPAILVVTDAYAEGWRARSRTAGSTERYELVPADGILKAVALGAGRHELRIEYAPALIRVGWAATGLGGLLAGLAVGWGVMQRAGVRSSPSSPSSGPS